METKGITSKDVLEAMEQVRAGFTISRITLGAVTLLYPLKKKGEKWAKKFTKIQEEYHKFLLDTYNEFEEEYNKLLEDEKKKNVQSNDVFESPVPQSVVDELLNNPYKANDVE